MKLMVISAMARGSSSCYILASPRVFDGHLTKAPMRDDVVGLAALARGGMAALNTLNGMPPPPAHSALGHPR